MAWRKIHIRVWREDRRLRMSERGPENTPRAHPRRQPSYINWVSIDIFALHPVVTAEEVVRETQLLCPSSHGVVAWWPSPTLVPP